MIQFRMLVTLILIGSIMIFTVQNYEVVEIKFLAWTIATSRALLLFFVLATGILIGWILHGFK